MKKTIITTIILISSLIGYPQKDSLPVNKENGLSIKEDTLYQLTMKASELNFIITAIFSPDDISPNQRKALDAWLRREIKVIPPKKK